MLDSCIACSFIFFFQFLSFFRSFFFFFSLYHRVDMGRKGTTVHYFYTRWNFLSLFSNFILSFFLFSLQMRFYFLSLSHNDVQEREDQKGNYLWFSLRCWEIKEVNRHSTVRHSSINTKQSNAKATKTTILSCLSSTEPAPSSDCSLTVSSTHPHGTT